MKENQPVIHPFELVRNVGKPIGPKTYLTVLWSFITVGQIIWGILSLTTI